MAENKKFSVRTDGKGNNVFVSDVFLLSVPEEERTKVLSINDDGRVVLTSASGSGGGGVTSIIAGTNITISPIGGTGAVTINASGGGGDVTEVTSATTNQITVANSTGPNPAISAVTAAISNGGTGLATADQIHTFVTTQTDEIDSDTSGNAATATLAADATTLATPRAINGVDFDGSAAITVPAAGSTLTDTVTVAKGGTNATSFADKSVIITQDSGTDTLAAVAMSTNGQLLIGGTDGPAVAVPTGGDGLTVTVGNGTLEYGLDASLTTVTSLLNTSLVVGRDATDQIKFSTDNQIIFRVDGADGVTFKTSGEIEATKFDGALEGNADTATALATARAINGVDFDGSAAITVPAAGSTLTDTVTVAKGGTNATSFADKSVIITQDTGTDTLAAVAMSTNGQLLIGGTSGPAVAVPTGGDGLTVTVGNGTLEYGLDASLTTVTSITHDSLVVGRDDTDQIKFSTDNQIIFRVDGADGVTFKALGEIEATKFDGDLEGNADTATLATDATTLATPRAINGVNFDGSAAITVPAAGSTLTDTVTVAKGGTGATSFADKSVIITQDSGTDTLAAVAMSTNGQLLIGGTDGPAVATLTAGTGISVINSNGGVTVLAHLGVGTTITADKNTTNIDKGYFYSMDSSGGPITFTLNSSGGAEIGDEWEFFVLDLSNDITFAAAPGESIISENGLKANAVGSGIVAKFIAINTWALVGSLKS